MHVKSTLAAALVAVVSAAPAAVFPRVTGPPVLSVSLAATSPPAATMAPEPKLAPVDNLGVGPVINGPEGSHIQLDFLHPGPGPGPVIVDVTRKTVGGEVTKLEDKWSKAPSPHYVVHDDA
jgi:hypothetical protein